MGADYGTAVEGQEQEDCAVMPLRSLRWSLNGTVAEMRLIHVQWQSKNWPFE